MSVDCLPMTESEISLGVAFAIDLGIEKINKSFVAKSGVRSMSCSVTVNMFNSPVIRNEEQLPRLCFGGVDRSNLKWSLKWIGLDRCGIVTFLGARAKIDGGILKAII